MKNLMLLIPLACLLLTSCSTEEINEPTVEQKLDTAYVFKLSKTNDWEVTTTIDPRDKSNNTFNSRKNVNSLHTHGNFGGFGGGQVSFSGTQNNGGAHGSAALEVTFGPFGTANVVLETINVVSIGNNEVIYGGQITEVLENTVMFPTPPGFPIPSCDTYELGSYVYFAVKDNGQGNNAPSDQYSPILINICNEIPSIETYIPWTLIGFNDVESSKDKIKVND
ncbi:MAG: hypothetical protein ACJARX_000050 [Psychroserpens sp.]|jgi:hypothetical protein|uniref:hypothetical protein n=1 Tax=Psychroserpens sp. TaxID=2020870 RepID=UPI0039E57723